MSTPTPEDPGAATLSRDEAFTDLRAANMARQIEWDQGQQFDLIYFGNALAGEVGEACNVIKKLHRLSLGVVGSRATVADLADELADVVIYADLLAAKAGINLFGEAVPAKFNATSEKYGFAARLRAPVAPAPIEPGEGCEHEFHDWSNSLVSDLAICHKCGADQTGTLRVDLAKVPWRDGMRPAALHKPAPAPADEIRIIFDGPPSHESGRFIEVEDAYGHGMRVGEWHERADGCWELRIPWNAPAPPDTVPVWRDMSSAPKDGTRFWGRVKEDAIAMFWMEEFSAFVSSFRRMTMAPGYTIDGEPAKNHSPRTHEPSGWMPMPAEIDRLLASQSTSQTILGNTPQKLTTKRLASP